MNIMRKRFGLLIFLYLLFIACACISCESGSSDGSNIVDTPISTDDRELIGTWAGWFAYGEDNFDVEYDNDDPNDIFAIGILTLELEARFIGDSAQLVCYEGDFSVTDYVVRKNFGGDFYFYIYNTTTGTDYEATYSGIRFAGGTILTNDFLSGNYVYLPVPDPIVDYWEALFINYSVEDIYSDVHKLSGAWHIENSFVHGNTLDITIAAAAESTIGTITGSDTNGNTITNGEIIEIHYYDTTKNIPATDMYRINFTLTAGGTSTDLSGLATYIENMDSSGVEVEQEVLAIGATSYGSDRMLTGIATKVP